MKISSRELKRLMKKAGISLEEVSDVEKVEIYLRDGRIIRINEPIVTKMYVGDKATYQIVGSEELVEAEKAGIEEEAEIEISDEDIEIVMQQTGVDRELAIKALKMTNGDIAQAILLLKQANL